jgi:hypothetical protein
VFALKDVEVAVEKCLELDKCLVVTNLLLCEVGRVYQMVEHHLLCFLDVNFTIRCFGV